MSHERQRKPYRRNGLPISHGELYVQHLLAAHHGFMSQRQLDDEDMTHCPGLMVHLGDTATGRDGQRTVEWDGDVWHHEIVCEACGWTTTTPTDYKLDYQIKHPPKGQKEAKTMKKEPPPSFVTYDEPDMPF